jgi:effector-binding domain-containing protein
MLTDPKVEERTEQHYMAICSEVNMKNISTVLPPLIPQIRAWMDKNNIIPSGPPFFKYFSMDKNDHLQVDVGIPVASPMRGEGKIVPDTFPAGKYATIIYTGDYRHLKDAHMKLEEWMTKKGLNDRLSGNEQKAVWRGRTEFYLVDESTEPDPEKWQTEITFLLK